MSLPLFEQLSLFGFLQPKPRATREPVGSREPKGRQPGPKSGTQSTQRHIHLGNRIVEYTLRQAPRRRLSLSIDERGLRVAAPRTISLAEIEAFVRSHGEWVLAKLDAYAGTPRRQIVIRDGQRLPLLGSEIEVRVVAGANRSHWQDDEEPNTALATLVIAARADADLEALARRALQRRAHAFFLTRIDHYRHHIARPVPPLALSSARTRWGSCSASGIRLNWRLIHLPLPLIDYVVAHELAHLEQMNHSPRFWAVVERMYPDYQAARSELKRVTLEIPVI